jgi:DtxR family Mn-dependent transcriptional regulator
MEDLKKKKEGMNIHESEHIEMYLKALWYIVEKGKEPKISSIAKLLNIRQTSVIEMLRKLNEINLVEYEKQYSENHTSRQ